jgi:hypothetical protein
LIEIIQVKILNYRNYSIKRLFQSIFSNLTPGYGRQIKS